MLQGEGSLQALGGFSHLISVWGFQLKPPTPAPSAQLLLGATRVSCRVTQTRGVLKMSLCHHRILPKDLSPSQGRRRLRGDFSFHTQETSFGGKLEPARSGNFSKEGESSSCTHKDTLEAPVPTPWQSPSFPRAPPTCQQQINPILQKILLSAVPSYTCSCSAPVSPLAKGTCVH